ncbi:MAG: NADH-quinone oxidoreductase subunit, partial [Actinomycetota bacterium]|nr:NADH-quinone oxidoreductase subunit [Actinomycetota bacterium]
MTNLLAAEQTRQAAAASGVFRLTWLLIALPLAGAVVLLLGGRRTDRFGHVLGTVLP